MTLQPGKQAIEIHRLPNMSKGKDNQRIKFGQFIEYNMGNIFVQRSCFYFIQSS